MWKVGLCCSLDRALQTVDLKPTYEDIFQAESSSVEEYLQQMHEMTVITAIQVLAHTCIAHTPRTYWMHG